LLDDGLPAPLRAPRPTQPSSALPAPFQPTAKAEPLPAPVQPKTSVAQEPLPAPFQSENRPEPQAPRVAPVAASPAEPQAPVAIPSDADPVVLYQESLDALRSGHHGQAVAGFRALVERHPTHGLADNAIYWLGEADYDRQRYDAALSTFQEVLTAYPLGNKVPDAMLKIGLCFLNLGEQPQAVAILRQLDEIYPDSDAARIARERLHAHAGASHP
jgi:tol-pal system protein YbgF